MTRAWLHLDNGNKENKEQLKKLKKKFRSQMLQIVFWRDKPNIKCILA